MSLNAADMVELSRQKAIAVTGEVVEDDSDYELDADEELLAELKASRDLLRRCLVLLYFLDTHVERITKREHTFLQKDIERIENRLEEADEVIERCEGE